MADVAVILLCFPYAMFWLQFMKPEAYTLEVITKKGLELQAEEMDSVHCNSLLLLLGSKFFIGFHSPSNIEADSVHSQLQPSQLYEIQLTKWLHPCNQILMQTFQAYHGCRRLLLWSWIHMQIWTSWYLFGRLPCPKVERSGSPSTWLITVQSFLYFDKCKYIKC